MCDCDIIEWMGVTSRFITFLTFLIHFIHPLLCIANYCAWVCYQDAVLGSSIVNAYLAMSIVAAVFYLFVSSVFYMWAWRFPEPEEVSKRRRIYGILVNLLFSDIPLFVIEVKICWIVQFANGMQGTSFVFTCISLMYSAVRVWIFIMIKLIKVRAPMVGAQPQFAGVATYSGGGSRQNGGMHPSYYGNSLSREGIYSNNGSRNDYPNGVGNNYADVTTPDDHYRRGSQNIDARYNGGQYSTPGTRSRQVY
ncbi:uncharacterized protein TM35_000045100 [Trypanosoma theileri]|uniref:Transmembrane protein n=1 Tax=Trypanosoma theileri TaxID=67003 RepID=A0A1X0P5T1_9TRYP|nr:uncharacterized protein TM35_000045100 [Trypanosoma theileri]ORC92296.1 hypothetical protein TM35_000045100 [Trypanosoma theileri]